MYCYSGRTISVELNRVNRRDYLELKTKQPAQNSYWVQQGHFAAGEYPGAVDPNHAAQKLEELLDAGIDHFIDLTESGELVPYEEIAKQTASSLELQVGWERHPIRDLSVPQSPEQMRLILDAIDDALDEGKTVYVHCWGGVGRTGTVVGCWFVRHGQSGDEALRTIAERWRHMQKADRAPCSPETWEQRDYVRNWKES